MRVDNQLLNRELTQEEMRDIEDAASILEERFKKEVFACKLLAVNNDASQIYGMVFTFRFPRKEAR